MLYLNGQEDAEKRFENWGAGELFLFQFFSQDFNDTFEKQRSIQRKPFEIRRASGVFCFNPFSKAP